MNSEFNWWLLIVGLGVGAGLTWLILSDLARREDELADRDIADEVAWVDQTLSASGHPTSPEIVGRVLRLHRAYLRRREDLGGTAGTESSDAPERASRAPAADGPASPSAVRAERGATADGPAAEATATVAPAEGPPPKPRRRKTAPRPPEG